MKTATSMTAISIADFRRRKIEAGLLCRACGGPVNLTKTCPHCQEAPCFRCGCSCDLWERWRDEQEGQDDQGDEAS